MPCAWEIQHQETVLCGILHVDTVTIAWSFGLRNLIIPGPILPLTGMPYDMARNVACMKALEAGVDALFFLDSDVVAPRDTILRLLAHNVPIVSGVYCRRSPPHGVPVMIKNGQWHTNYRTDRGLFEVDLVGSGCLLLRREYLQKIPPLDPERGRHWFDWRVDRASLLPPGEGLSEDFSMCLHARRNGYKVLVDPTILCRHIGYAEASYSSFKPMEATPIT